MWPMRVPPWFFCEVAGDALLQVARLAHVEHAAFRVVVAVDAGQLRQGRDLRQQFF
jgi:hypothetical protein